MNSASSGTATKKTRSPSSGAPSVSSSSSVSSSVPSGSCGVSPVRQALICFCSSLHPRHCLGQRVMWTFPVIQSILGLCSLSQECPRMRSCFPSCVTASTARSACVPIWRTATTASEISPASLAVPSMLNTGIGHPSFLVVSPLVLTYLESMNIPVAPESTSARTCRVSAVSTVSSSSLTWSALGPGSVTAITSLFGSLRSQCFRRLFVFGVVRNSAGFGATSGSLSSISCIVNTVNLLFTSRSGGASFIRCVSENPLLQTPLLLPLAPHLMPPEPLLLPPVSHPTS